MSFVICEMPEAGDARWPGGPHPSEPASPGLRAQQRPTRRCSDAPRARRFRAANSTLGLLGRSGILPYAAPRLASLNLPPFVSVLDPGAGRVSHPASRIPAPRMPEAAVGAHTPAHGARHPRALDSSSRGFELSTRSAPLRKLRLTAVPLKCAPNDPLRPTRLRPAQGWPDGHVPHSGHCALVNELGHPCRAGFGSYRTRRQ